MNLRALIVLSIGTWATACGVMDDGDSTAEDVTVHPTGSSTLGVVELQIPSDVAPADGEHLLTLHFAPAPGQPVKVQDAGGDLLANGSLRVTPGTYCFDVSSSIGRSWLQTTDCGVVVKPGATTKVTLSTVIVKEEDTKLLASQQTMTGGVTGITLADATGQIGELDLRGVKLASLPGKITASVDATGATWTPSDTNVGANASVVLNLPKNDKVVRFTITSEATTLPDALGAGAGVNWRWDGAPSSAAQWARPRSVRMDSDVTLFASDTGKLVFELGGIERSYPLDRPGTFAVPVHRIDVTDVTDTDDRGHAQTIRGSFTVRRRGEQSLLRWNGRDFFSTGNSVFVWSGDYTVDVRYAANGVQKQYSEDVHVP